MILTILALLFWTAAAGSADTLRKVWLEGPYGGVGTRSYTLWLSDFTDVLAVEADVLVEGQAGMAEVLPRAEDAGFILAANAVYDTLLIALARAEATAHAAPWRRSSCPTPNPCPTSVWSAWRSTAGTCR